MKESCPHCFQRMAHVSGPPLGRVLLLMASLAMLPQRAPLACGQEVSPVPVATASAQAEAVKKYPALGVAGSDFNREFLSRMQIARTERPGFFDNPLWPVALADEVARALPAAASQVPSPAQGFSAIVPPPAPPVDWYTGHSSETFEKLPAALQKLDRQTLDDALLSAAIFHATNSARRTHGLRRLAALPALRAAAYGHSRDMATLGFFSHENSRDLSRATPTLRIESQGVLNIAAGENISRLVGDGYTYWGYARAVVAQWMKSQGHRANILNPRYTYLGCGAHPCRCPDFHLLATQNFAFVVSPAEPIDHR